MNILMLNQDWFSSQLREAGHRVITCGIAEHMQIRLDRLLCDWREVCAMVEGGFEPDLVIAHDNSAPLILSGLEELRCPSIFYAVDTHHHTELHCYLSQLFDHTFIAHRDYRANFVACGFKEPEWMPLWASRYVEPAPQRELKAVFVGTMNPKLNPGRVHFFTELQKRCDIFVTTGRFFEIFPKYAVVVNQSVKADLNFRVFEALMCGTALLTERIEHGLLELFKENQELVLYQKDNLQDCADKINWLLSDKALCDRLAEAGRQKILEAHTEAHRATQCLRVIEKLQCQPKPNRYLAVAMNMAQLAGHTFNVSPSTSVKAAVNCVNALQGIIQTKPVLDDAVAFYAVRAALLHDRLLKSNLGMTTLHQLQDMYPDIIVLRAAKLRDLLNSGRVEEAKAFAARISDLPASEVFQSAEEAVSIVLSTVE